MKISLSIREAYEAQSDLNGRLKATIDEVFGNLKKARWHYESRIKNLESFAVKIESGRARDPAALEDFFACTLVVPNSTELAHAQTIVTGSFDVKYRRPHDPAVTSKAPTDFPFDDLRLYVTRKNSGALRPSPLDDVVFEIQIKTFLQHAWSIATHDLVYKSDEIQWSKVRIASQVKAMIEHAELSIQEAATLSESALLAKTDTRTQSLADIVSVLRAQWARADLPDNVRGLALALDPILDAMNMSSADLNELLNVEKVDGHGSFDLNLSPYGVIIQALLRQRTNETVALLSDRSKRVRVVIAREVHMPPNVDISGFPNVIIVR